MAHFSDQMREKLAQEWLDRPMKKWGQKQNTQGSCASIASRITMHDKVAQLFSTTHGPTNPDTIDKSWKPTTPP
jgi:hypothetical protein